MDWKSLQDRLLIDKYLNVISRHHSKGMFHKGVGFSHFKPFLCTMVKSVE